MLARLAGLLRRQEEGPGDATRAGAPQPAPLQRCSQPAPPARLTAAAGPRLSQGRKVVFIFSKARSANSITSRLFEHNEHFIHFHEPFSAWRSRHANERSLHTDVDFLERLVECQLSSEEVYNVVTQVL